MLDLHSGGKKGKKIRYISVEGLVCPRVPCLPAYHSYCVLLHLTTTFKLVSGEKAELSCSQSLVLMPKDYAGDHKYMHACTQSHYLGTTVCCPP